jgi:TatD DNase family protein
MSIGLGGAVTFKNARVPVEVAAAVPLSHLVLETDAPYMAPVPFRGKRCDSTLIAYTAERIAQARTETGSPITPEELLRITAENAAALYHIPLEGTL